MQPTRTEVLPAEVSELTPAPPTRSRIIPLKRLTRAHLAIAKRPGAVDEAEGAMQAIAAGLSASLGAQVTLTATLVDATLHPFSHLGNRCLYAPLELAKPGAMALLEIDFTTAGLLLQRVAGAGPVGTPNSLTRIEEAALGWVLLSVLKTVRQQDSFHARYSPRLVRILTDRALAMQHLDGRRRHVALSMTVTVDGEVGGARLVVPAMFLQSSVSAFPEAPVPALSPEVLAATLPATCFVGWTLLDRADAAALKAGDVVTFGGLTVEEDQIHGRARLVTSTFELRGDFTPEGFTFTRATARTTPETHMSENDPSLPVEVEVELTRLHLPLSALGGIKPGQILQLHVNAAQHVTLRIGGRAVARAELVEVEGEIGARITALLGT